MKENAKIHFVFQMNVLGMWFQKVPPEGIEFIPKNENDLRITIKPFSPNDDKSGQQDGLLCKAFKSYPATDSQILFVNLYNNHRVMYNVAEGHSLPLGEDITIDGKITQGFSPSRDLCPFEIENLLNIVESELSSRLIRILKLIRWRQFCVAPVELKNEGTLYWKIGEGDYPIAPPKNYDRGDVTIEVEKGLHWSDEHSHDLQALWDDIDLIEPLGHTLLREASVLALESPRSSILIMTAALETAIKIHISSVAPDTEWLMETMPSPDIVKILHKFIPIIHSNLGNELHYWHIVKPSINKVQDLVKIRNKVAHTGKIPIEARHVNEYLEVVSDFLYLLDVLDGHEWAKTFVSKELRSKLNWPNSRDSRITIKVRVPKKSY